MDRDSRRPVFIALGFLVSGALLGYFLYSMRGDWAKVAEAFREAHYAWLLPSVGFIGLLYLCRVVRWHLFLSPLKQVSYLSLLSATCIGFMANCMLPVRLGEIIRPFVLSRREKIGLAQVLATALGLERAFDLIGLSVLLLITWAMLGAHLGGVGPGSDGSSGVVLGGVGADSGGGQGTSAAVGEAGSVGERPVARHIGRVWKYGLLLADLAAVGLFAFVLLAAFPAPLLRVAAWCTGLLPARMGGAVLGFFQSVAEAMQCMRSARNIFVAVLLSTVQWTMAGLSTYTLSLAFGLPLGVTGGFFVTVCVALGVALPQAPGYVGVFHVAAKLGAEVFRAPEAGAFAFANMLWVVNVVPITLVGLAFLWYEGASLQNLARASRRAALERRPPDEDTLPYEDRSRPLSR